MCRLYCFLPSCVKQLLDHPHSKVSGTKPAGRVSILNLSFTRGDEDDSSKLPVYAFIAAASHILGIVRTRRSHFTHRCVAPASYEERSGRFSDGRGHPSRVVINFLLSRQVPIEH